MIVPMKKVAILCLAGDRDRALEALRDLGVVHPQPTRPPEGAELDEARAALETTHAALQELGPAAASEAPAPEARPPALQPRDVLALAARRREAAEALARVGAELDAAAPLGRFDPDLLRDLAEHGIHLRLFTIPPGRPVEGPAGAAVTVLRRDRAGTLVAVVSDRPVDLDAQEVRLPPRPLDAVEHAHREAATRLAAIDAELQAAAAAAPAFRAEAERLEAALTFLEARAGMGREGEIAYLAGFAPVDTVDAIRTAAAHEGWGLVVDDPADAEDVPTLVRNPAWIRPIRFVFELIGVVPGYREADVSVAFLAFFSLFFAMVVGDAGYGAIFLGLTFLIRRLAPRAPRDLARLLGLLSVCTIVWGLLTGNVFGIARLPAPLAALRIDWLLDGPNLMSFCFLLGAIHLTLAHAWSAARLINSPLALAQLGWIAMTWTMYFAARNLILDYPLPGFVPGLFIAGLAAIALFMTPLRAMKQDWPNHIMLPLSVINSFGDVVSYVRLFAVGSAGTAISVAFNEMAVGEGISSFAAGLGAALILFAAHTMNIMLSALGVIVHGVRLNTLEFCGHMGIQWTGTKYRPFARRAGGADGHEPGPGRPRPSGAGETA